jgi:Rod binding domain-containing protein
MNTGLPPIDPTFEPASVRNGSPAVKKAYSDALDFESMLVQQMTQSLAATSGLGASGGEGESEESEGTSDPAASQLSSLLPQTLSEGVMSHGGLGLAPQLLGSIERSQGIAVAPAKVNTNGGVTA